MAVVTVTDELTDMTELRIEEALDKRGLLLSCGGSPNAGEAVWV